MKKNPNKYYVSTRSLTPAEKMAFADEIEKKKITGLREFITKTNNKSIALKLIKENAEALKQTMI